MVKKIAKFFAYFLFFIVLLMYFTPKESLYYLAEKELKSYGVIISSEDVKDRGLWLTIEHANVSLKAIPSALIKETSIKLFGVYNSVNIDNIALSSAASSFIPLNIAHLQIKYHILNPFHITFSTHGEFGKLQGTLNVLKHTLHIDLIASRVMKRKYRNTLRNLKKNSKGEYYYDKAL